MGLMNIPNPSRTGRIGKQVFPHPQSEYLRPRFGGFYILDWTGSSGGIIGELTGCQYVKYDGDAHFFSYIAPAEWGGLTSVVMISDQALTDGKVMIFEMIED